ncbi:hypothetical protein [Pantoea sp. ME81]|uniref:hypothetical protein n=1 Tax=Pantoea sp. ME81 TaxID=2743935 RepID=UPI0015F6F3F6|nr:hypothetical protein [Pantoea sp. ME81]
MNQQIYKALISDPKQAVYKSQLPDGKIAITLLVDDPELANNIVIEAKKANISVLDDSINKSSNTPTLKDLLTKRKENK